MPTETNENYSVEVAKEKQKTIRWAILIGAFFILGGAAIFLGKNLKINVKEGQLEVSKPIVEQVNQPTKNDTLTTIDFTTGTLKKEDVEKIKKLPNINPNGFSGKNYINLEYGYLFTCENPGEWNLTYTPANYNTGEPINFINAGNGIEFKMVVSENDENISLKELVKLLVMGSTTVNEEAPQVTYDDAGKIAFFKTYVKKFDKNALIKVIVTEKRGYIAAVYFPKGMDENVKVKELEKMVASVTLL